jgi:hypothetical protein
VTAALIPAFNEADRIGDTVMAALRIPGVTSVVVIDDGSLDDTGAAALAAGAHQVVTLPTNQGKGAALNAGWRVTGDPILLLLDADLGSSAAEAALLLEPVCSGAADMCIARFPSTGRGGGFGLAVGLARRGIKILTGAEMEAPLSGQRCLTRQLVETVGGFERGFGVETALTVRALQAGLRAVEVQTGMSHRVTGRDLSGMIHRARQFRDIAFTLARCAIRRPLVRGRRV